MLEAGLEGGYQRLRPRLARSLRPVSGQGQPRLLAQRRSAVPSAAAPSRRTARRRAVRPLRRGRRRAGRHARGPVPSTARRGGPARVRRRRPRRPARPRCGSGRPRAGPPPAAQLGERAPGHRQRLGDRPGGGMGIQAGEQFLAGEVPADPAARAHQDELAQPPGARPRPRADGAAFGDDGERAEQPDLYGQPPRRPLCPWRGHVPIVPHPGNGREHRGNSGFLALSLTRARGLTR